MRDNSIQYGLCLVCGKFPGPAWEIYCRNCGAQQQEDRHAIIEDHDSVVEVDTDYDWHDAGR